MKTVVVCGLFMLLSYVGCDTPANCSYEDIKGDWLFYEGERESDSSINCTNFSSPIAHTLKLTLLFPNLAVDEFGNKGFFTLVYNQGFEVVINYRKYFAFSLYKEDPSGNFTSHCDTILPGWSHDVLGKNWACYTGHKEEAASPSKKSFSLDSSQSPFTSPSPAHPVLKKIASHLPVEFDWRDVNGINYVSSVRNQGSCGSCYAFSSLAMLEARLRIMTNNTLNVTFSPQDVVSCSEYSQGCEGGYPYVIAGKYAQDFGVLPEECYPYEGHDEDCSSKKCKRFYVAKYNYVGGFFGGCNEELVKLDLVQNGPVTVAFQVYSDFMFYKSGVYHHTGIRGAFNPFHQVNHGVLITGYGTDNATGEKYWIVKNSWGTTWGENGYFRIRRGSDECNIESMAVSAIPIP